MFDSITGGHLTVTKIVDRSILVTFISAGREYFVKQKVIGLVFGAIVATVTVHASAFGLGDLTGSAGGSGASSISAKDLLGLYVGSDVMVTNGQVKLLNAVGLKDKAANLEAKAKNLTSGATSESLEDTATEQTSANRALQDKLTADKTPLTDEGKKQFSAGLIDLAKGVTGYVAMAGSVSKYKPSMSDIGAAAGSAMYIVKSLPATTDNLTTTLKSAIAFAKENKIEVPKEASAF